jgi:hypothetical protein
VSASATFAGSSAFTALVIPPSTGIQIPEGTGGAFNFLIPEGLGGATSYQVETMTQAEIGPSFWLGELEDA